MTDSTNPSSDSFIKFEVSAGNIIHLKTVYNESLQKTQIICDLCGKQVNITTYDNTYRFSCHRNSKSCKATQCKAEKQARQEHMAAILSAPQSGITLHHSQNTSSISGASTPRFSDYHSGFIPIAPYEPESFNLSLSGPSHFSDNIETGEDLDDEEEISNLTSSIVDLYTSAPLKMDATEASVHCDGVLVHWTPGSVWNTYPYQQHKNTNLSWEPIGFDEQNKENLYLHSKHCTGVPSSFLEISERVCSNCRGIPYLAEFQKFINHAVVTSEHTLWEYLNQKQLQSLLVNTTKKYRALKLKVSFLLLFFFSFNTEYITFSFLTKKEEFHN